MPVSRLNRTHLESLLLRVAPHLLVVAGPLVDAVDHEEGEEAVVDLLAEGLDERGAVRAGQGGVVLVLETNKQRFLAS